MARPLGRLEEAGLAVFVGPECPPGLDRAIHLPDADARDVAALILAVL